MVGIAKYFSSSTSTWKVNLVILLAEGAPSSALDDFPQPALTFQRAKRTIFSVPGILGVLLRKKPSVIVSSLPHVSAAVSLANLITGGRAMHVVRVESILQRPPGLGLSGRIRESIMRRLIAQADHYVVVSRELIEPSSTITNSKSRKVCRRILAIDSPIEFSLFRTGIMQEI